MHTICFHKSTWRNLQSEFVHANVLNDVSSIYITPKDNFFLSLEAGFSEWHQQPVRIKAFAGEKAAQHYRTLLADQPLWWEVETLLWVWSCFLPSAQSLPIPGNLLSGCLVLYDLSNSLHVEQVRGVLSTGAAIRLFAGRSKCDNCRVQVSGSSRKAQGFCSSSSMCAAACRSPSGCRDAKGNKSDLISGPESYWNSTARTPAVKIPYSPTQACHTWITFGDGSCPMLVFDQHRGAAWGTPHRHVPKTKMAPSLILLS